MMKNRVEFAVLFILILSLTFLTGCMANSSPQSEWEAQAITSYHIQVTEISLWNIQTHDITVENGIITKQSATCQPSLLSFDGNCQIEPYNAEDFTVPGLFSLAQRYSEGDRAEWTTVTYDETYHFPAMISYNDPDIYDEEVSWHVDLFEVLP